MNPPDPGLSRSVRFGMRAAAMLPRAVVRMMLVAQGRGSEGMTDDICRVARPWGFDVEAVASAGRVIVWHAEGDPQVPVAPWRRIDGIELHVVDGDSHEVPRELWEEALARARRDEPTRLVLPVLAPAAHLVHVEQRAREQEHHDRERENAAPPSLLASMSCCARTMTISVS